MSAPKVDGPHGVPNLRLWLLNEWRVGGPYEALARASRSAWELYQPTFEKGWTDREESAWQRGHLSDPDLFLWWVSADMVDEVSHVAAELPADIKPTDVPALTFDGFSTRGLVVLEKPMAGLDSRDPGVTVTVDAFVYGGTKLPPTPNRPFYRLAVGMSCLKHFRWDEGIPDELMGMAALLSTFRAYRYTKAQHDPPAEFLYGDEWMPMGRSDWPINEPVSAPIDDDVSGQQLASMVEDRRWIAALHLVAADHRVARTSQVKPAAKQDRRPSERKGLSATVRVVYLRELDRPKGDGETGTHGRKAPRPHIVRSHPRWQAWGPDRSLRKLILVPRHARGHGDGPPEQGPPTVRAVIR